MDIRKVKKLIELLEESNIDEIEIHEGEESVRISRNKSGGAPVNYVAAPAPAASAPAPVASPAPASSASEPAAASGIGSRWLIVRVVTLGPGVPGGVGGMGGRTCSKLRQPR